MHLEETDCSLQRLSPFFPFMTSLKRHPTKPVSSDAQAAIFTSSAISDGLYWCISLLTADALPIITTYISMLHAEILQAVSGTLVVIPIKNQESH
jgi:hypothetical protein